MSPYSETYIYYLLFIYALLLMRSKITLGNRPGWHRYRNRHQIERKLLNWERRRPGWQKLRQQTVQSSRLLQGGDAVWGWKMQRWQP